MTTTSRRARRHARPPLELDLHLQEWGARGFTDAVHEARRIPVDRGIPGEEVVAVVDRRRTPWRGVVDRVLVPSQDRVVAPCPYYHVACGGCQWQHMQYEAQLAAKRGLAERALQRAGVGYGIDEVHGMDVPWRYRRTAAIALGWEAGFRPRGRRGIVEIHDCLIAHPLIGALADRMNAVLRDGLLPNYHGKVWLDCTVVGSESAPALQVLIQGIAGLTLETHSELPEVARVIAAGEAIHSVAYRHRDGEARPLTGPLLGTIEIAGNAFFLPAGAFCQTNIAMLDRLIAAMHSRLANVTVRQAADVYGGIGTFALNLADRCQQMVLIELDAQAVQAAAASAARLGLTNVAFQAAHAERALPELVDLDLVIVDPPRSGLGELVVESLGAAQVPLLLYVSCAPDSLARDLAGLETRGYRVESIELYDFYPQTYHVETFAVLTR